MTDLDRLIAAVEAGDWLSVLTAAAKAFPRDTADIVRRDCYYWVLDAYRNKHGLDAALRLHKALLPGWDYCIDYVQRTRPLAYVEDDGGPTYSGEADNPARAVLLAILRAVKARGSDGV